MNQNNLTPAALSAALRGDHENFRAASTPGGIEAQEKAGQIEQSFRETLPIKGTIENRTEFERLGFQFGENEDDIFVRAKFPKGWRKRPTEHSMWTELLDDRGRPRCLIFYKAAFYDRHSHISFTTRYSCCAHHESGSNYLTVIQDAGSVIHTIATRGKGESHLYRPHYDEALAWLNTNFPDWQNTAAYWD